ncbi:MAG: winged helix-turn-helix transcriptional regulator [Clostridia bacterium]|nr:winged helix-turn-helix transcriptional regulator [Clostridia bacterium]
MSDSTVITPFSFLTEKEAVERKTALPEKKISLPLSSFFKIFGDQTRLGILFLLHGGPLSVGDLAALMDMTPSAVSHQLKLLKSAQLVQYRREGKTLFYSLADEHIQHILEIGLEHIKE